MLDFLIHYGYMGLFIACFLAATVIPLSSEAVIIALVAAGLGPETCIIVATAGSGLGGMTNYYLGWLGKVEWMEKYLRVKKERVEKTQVWINRRGGAYVAFFSFLPILGDLLPLALGFMKASVWKVGVSLFTGKFLRYVVVVYMMDVFVRWLGPS